MKDKDDKFVKLSFYRRKKASDIEASHEITPLTKEEIHRIKIKAQQRLTKH